MNEPTEKQKRFLSLESILLVLNSAKRTGAEKDIPEGSRVVTISDTLCKEMINTIESYVDEGFEYLTHNKKGTGRLILQPKKEKPWKRKHS